MQFHILGAVEALDEGRVVTPRGSKQRALLALLLIHANELLSTDRVIAELWGERPPATAAKTVQVHISRLRKALTNGTEGQPNGLISTRGHGYVLKLEPEQLDSQLFERLAADGGRELEQGRPDRAVAALEKALSLWRGPALADVVYEEFATSEAARLDDLRIAALEQLIDAKLELARHADVVPELQALIREHPHRERLRAQLMLALYRCDRQADALQAYQDTRTALVEELGIEPGERLRELERAVLAQDPALALPHLPADIQPLRSLSSKSSRADGLPSLPNRTIGRENDVSAVVQHLRFDGVRLLTLTGPGGVGKTRLALEASRAAQGDFPDGAHFVSLAALRRPEDLPGATVKALAIVVLSGESAEQAAERFLSAKHLLLVVDNFEHLLAAAPFIGRLLRGCAALTVLATSREPLGLQAEELYPVSPLAVPPPGTPVGAEALVDVDAVALFCARARARDPDFELDDAAAAAVAGICRRVDGLPLAIELAAARCGLLAPDEIAERLQDALGALGHGARDAPARQQTLRATIDWSHELLTDAEKQCFARLAVFAGGATVTAAETITHAELETLDGLVAKSLLVRASQRHSPTRVWMLDTVRAYAAERFADAADADAVREDHYRYYLALAQRHGTERALWGADAAEHLARLDAEVNNLHAALGWAVGQASAEQALAMAAALGCYWYWRNRYADAVGWVEQTLSLPGADAHPALRVRALCAKARCLWPLGRQPEQRALTEEVEAIARRLGDPVILSQALRLRVDCEMDDERLAVADALADEALDWARAAGDKWEIAEVSRRKAIASSGVADLRVRVDAAASLLSDVGNVHQLAHLLTSAAYSALCLGSERDAAEFVARATPVAQTLNEPFTWMMNSGNVALTALLMGETGTASHAFREELALCRDMVCLPVLLEALRGLAAVAVIGGHDKRAATLVGAAGAHGYGRPEDPVQARLDETFFKPARTRCGTDRWDSAEHEGSALSFEGAIAYALERRD